MFLSASTNIDQWLNDLDILKLTGIAFVIIFCLAM